MQDAHHALLKKCWRISLFVTDDVMTLCDEKLSKNGGKRANM